MNEVDKQKVAKDGLGYLEGPLTSARGRPLRDEWEEAIAFAGRVFVINRNTLGEDDAWAFVRDATEAMREGFGDEKADDFFARMQSIALEGG